MLPQSSFANRIHLLFQQWRKRKFDPTLSEWLATAPLFRTAWVDAVAVIDPAWPQARRIELFLAWVIEWVRTTDGEAAAAKKERHVYILQDYYGQRFSAKAVYLPLGGSESTFRTNWCKEATQYASERLYAHWQDTGETAVAGQWRVYAQSRSLAPAYQSFLQLLTVSQRPWPVAALMNLFLNAAKQPTWAGLPTANWLQEPQPFIAEALACFTRLGWLYAASPVDGEPMIELNAAIRQQLDNFLQPEERQQAHRLAAQGYGLAQARLDACWHWQSAGDIEQAAQAVLASGQPLLAAYDEEVDAPPGQLARLAELVQRFDSKAFASVVWGQLKQLAGRIAQLQAAQAARTDPAALARYTEIALAEYKLALLYLTKPQAQALVYFQMARLYSRLDNALAVQSFKLCLMRLDAHQLRNELWARTHLRCAWLYIQQCPDLIAAEAHLKQARLPLNELGPPALLLWSDWHNAWGTLAFCKGEFQKGVEALTQGIALLTDQPDRLRLCKLLHNQGLEFSAQPHADQTIALYYLEQSLTIAQQLDHRFMQMLCHKVIGGCYFRSQNFAEAILAYQQAYALMSATPDFKAYLCYDLAEAYAHILQIGDAIHFFKQGLEIAQTLHLSDILVEFQNLTLEYPWLQIETYAPRMAWAIQLLHEQGRLKSKAYAEMAKINDKTAMKDIQMWLDQKIVRQVGKARATYYELNRPTPIVVAGGQA
ncbi:MAG: hypothetical protein U0350_30755 [Caldilineaceae bacterium]